MKFRYGLRMLVPIFVLFSIVPWIASQLIERHRATSAISVWRSSAVRLNSNLSIAGVGTPAENDDGFIILKNSGKFGLEALKSLLKDVDPIMKRNGVIALGALKDRAGPATIDLLALLSDDELRCEVIYSLGEIGPSAKDAIPRLAQISCWDEAVASNMQTRIEGTGAPLKTYSTAYVKMISWRAKEALYKIQGLAGEIGQPNAGAEDCPFIEKPQSVE